MICTRKEGAPCRRKPFFSLTLLLIVFWNFQVSVFGEDGRFALIISNAQYKQKELIPELENAAGDGELIGSVLREAGFAVTSAVNLSKDELVHAFSRFAKELPKKAEAVVFFSGHGFELGTRPCLLGTDAVFDEAGALESGEVFVSDIVSLVSEASPRVGLFFFDCCREILDQSARESDGLRRIVNRSEKGYPEMLISFSSEPGGVALDGRELGLTESPYASSLARAISSGYELSGLMKKVRQDVFRITGGRQRTWESSSLVDDFFFSKQEFTLPGVADVEPNGDSKPEKAEGKSGGKVWNLFRYEGREYVTIENIHRFFQFKTLDRKNGNTLLAHSSVNLHFVDGTTELRVNRYLYFLSFPSVVHENTLLISTVDLAKLIDPVVRPSYIKRANEVETIALVFEESPTTEDESFEDSIAKLSADSDIPITYLLSDSEKERAEWLSKNSEGNDRAVVLFRFDVPGLPPNSIRTFTLAPQGSPPTGGRRSESVGFPMVGNRVDGSNIALATAAHSALVHSSQGGLFDLGLGRTLFPEMRAIGCPAALVEMGRFEGEWKERPGRSAEAIVSALNQYVRAVQSRKNRE